MNITELEKEPAKEIEIKVQDTRRKYSTSQEMQLGNNIIMQALNNARSSIDSLSKRQVLDLLSEPEKKTIQKNWTFRLAKLEKLGQVRKTGSKSGTKYWRT